MGIRSFAHLLYTLLFKIAHFKEGLWAIHSLKKSDVSDFHVIRANSLQKKQVNHSKLIFFNCFSPVYAQEWSAPLPLYSIATVSDWLMTIEQWERFALFHEQIALPLTKNEQMAWKTAERIPNPELSCWETGRPLMRRSKKFQN